SIEGEVFFEKAYRALYATDGSHYEILPLGVVYPRHGGDIQKVIELCAEERIPLIPRGGGTGLTGGAVGKGLVMDFTRYMNQLLEVDEAKRLARVQPGIILDELNSQLQDYQLHWPIDTATGNRAVIGGQIGNNSSGMSSLQYGLTLHHVEGLKSFLANGESCYFHIQPGSSRGYQVYDLEARVFRIVESLEGEIQRRTPTLLRKVGGYNLHALGPNKMGLAGLIIGSEGTLSILEEAFLRLSPKPLRRDLLVLAFPSLSQALEILPLLLSFHPTGIELLDEVILEKAKASSSFRTYLSFLDSLTPALNQFPKALFIILQDGSSLEEQQEKINSILQGLEQTKSSFSWGSFFEDSAKAQVVGLRKAALPLLLSGRMKAVTGVEDTAVSPEKLCSYIKEFQDLLEKYNTHASFYGHASVGCLHIRPFFELSHMSHR
ncbi:MAG: FAD-binding oxidoreductase, partial [Planctomycetota bacterium]